MTLEELKALPYEDQQKVFKELKAKRHMAKTVNFSSLYNVGVKKLAKTLSIRHSDAKVLLDAFWKRNWAVKKVEEHLKVKTVGGLKWLYNPVSGFWYELREERNKFSVLNQSTGAYVFDRWLEKIIEYRPQLTGQMHDECILTVKKGNREKCESLLKNSMISVNKALKLNVNIGCSVSFGDNYADIH